MDNNRTNKQHKLYLTIFTTLVVGLFAVYGYMNFISRGTVDQMIDGYQVVDVILPDNTVIHSWVADTPSKRSKGLAVVDSLDVDEGMLFIFDSESNYPFWMKDMKFSIDIIWLNAQKEIVYIKEDAEPKDYPNSYIPNTEESLYVLEIASGLVQEYDLELGGTLVW